MNMVRILFLFKYIDQSSNFIPLMVICNLEGEASLPHMGKMYLHNTTEEMKRLMVLTFSLKEGPMMY